MNHHRRQALLGLVSLVPLVGGCDEGAPGDALDAPLLDRDSSSIDAPLSACGTSPSTSTKLADVAYATTSTAQKLDLYVPNGTGPYPVVVWIHGGGWQGGDKAPGDVRQANRGYVVASMNYRLSGEAIFPAQIHDVKAAIRWLRANAALHKIDPAKIAVFGSSAGGHLAALAGTSGGVARLEDPSLGNPNESSVVQAVVDFYGPSDFLQMDANVPATCTSPLAHDLSTSPESKVIGCQIQTCPAQVNAANPIAYVTADDPPFLIKHGKVDCTVPPHQSQLMTDALVQGGVPVSLELIDGAGHGGPPFGEPTRAAEVDRFFDLHLKGCR